MTNYKKFLWSFVCLPILAACSADEPVSGSTENGGLDEEGVYMTVNLSLDGAGPETRSFTNGDGTSNNGTEVGTDDENKVNSVLIALASPTNNAFIAYSYVSSEKQLSSNTVGSQKIYKANAKFTKTAINSYYSGLNTTTGEDQRANVFVYCNPGTRIIEQFKSFEQGNTTWYNDVYTLTDPYDNTLWNSSTGFLMTNVKSAPRLLPATMADWNLYTAENRPFDLSGLNNAGRPSEVDNQTGRGAINVQRIAARFDFRDGSQMNVENGNGAKGQPFTYNVIRNKDEKPTIQATLVKMALVNMNKQVYPVGRVSANGLNANAEILGVEKPWYSDANGTPIAGSGNYIVTPLSDRISSLIASSFAGYKASDIFFYPFFGEDNEVGGIYEGAWDTDLTKDVVKNVNDNFGEKSYHVWKYVTENAIPGSPSNQTNGVSTGVVFKSKMKATDELKNSGDKWDLMLYNAINNVGGNQVAHADDPVLYSFAGKVFVTWNHVQTAALLAAGYDPSKNVQKLDRSVSLYMACFGNGGAGTLEIEGKTFTDTYPVDETSANYGWTKWAEAGFPEDGEGVEIVDYRKKVTDAGFTIFQTSVDEACGGKGYYTYYYYWNRHNDNGQNGVMGNMEFAVVRNNVYKLAVTRLSTLGHPRLPQNDPDSPKPGVPDEKSDLYITVSVKVVPWTVRLNNIEL
ncbi:MAG: Mfa1 family fimbria major subunit [Muribaculaceae bacterium]|nr:Mfa1 family fimbria major subunit [Muribaculaceae bacterium]